MMNEIQAGFFSGVTLLLQTAVLSFIFKLLREHAIKLKTRGGVGWKGVVYSIYCAFALAALCSGGWTDEEERGSISNEQTATSDSENMIKWLVVGFGLSIAAFYMHPRERDTFITPHS